MPLDIRVPSSTAASMWSCTLTTLYPLWERALGNVLSDHDRDYEVDSNDEEIKDGSINDMNFSKNYADYVIWTNFT